MEIKQLEQQELDSLKSIQNEIGTLITNLGNIELQKILLEFEKEKLIKQVEEIKEKEKTIALSLQQKYGEGNINLETGEFTIV